MAIFWRMMTTFLVFFLYCLFKAHCYLIMAYRSDFGLRGKQSAKEDEDVASTYSNGEPGLMPT